MISLMYHFIGGDENLKGIDLASFRSQLDLLQSRYPSEGFELTFDHGTVDHIEVAAPELEKRGLRGIFFVLTMVPEEGRIATIDKQRFLEAARRTELARALCTELGLPYEPEDAAGYLPAFSFYSLEERYLRLLRDTRIAAADYDAFIGREFQHVFGDEAAFAERHYLTWDQIAELHHRGHIIGSHSHHHHGDRADYERSVGLIRSRVGAPAEYVSYPNGFKRIKDDELEAIGVRWGYVSTPAGRDRYTAPRIDCMEWWPS